MAASMGRGRGGGSTSFQKKARAKSLHIPGTRPSPQGNQLLVSTGVPSLDHIIGGGVVVGTVLLVEEDTFGNYARLLVKYFMAEGIMARHPLLLSSAELHPRQLLGDLPAPVSEDVGKTATHQGDVPSEKQVQKEAPMKIAWRYQNLPTEQPELGAFSQFGHYYDLSRTMSSEMTDSAPSRLFYLPDELPLEEQGAWTGSITNPAYVKLLQSIRDVVMEGQFDLTVPQPKDVSRTVLRIGLHCLGSPLWGEQDGGASHDASLPHFLHALRALLRTSLAACLVTVPTHLFQDAAFTRRLEKLCDSVVRLESFAGSEKEQNPAYRDYHGLLYVRQLSQANSLLSHVPDCSDFAFKLRRKKFAVEKLHLPPELQESQQREQDEPVAALKTSAASCFTSGKSKLDF
ncbi:PREDICTED: elongator complex protein 4-like [Branchiostoma belcheri]|uniref:Elongator complex protein 4 n=1 Tax=Branchiostoma belcheri TaxID=7741 RepID=A0A6P4YBD2_BRABE|nr:PREDICTED: elongator complex protein 4-like [Branchiostoma belcheri]